MKKTVLTILGTLLLAGSAYAEYFEGTITEINRPDNKMAFTRTDNAERVEVKVKDPTALDLVRPGSPVRVQADKDLIGWTATSIQVPQDQLNVPDEQLLQTAEFTNYNFANPQNRQGISANESLSKHARPGVGGSEVGIRTERLY